MDSLDDFTADHFFQRNWFLGLADSLKSLKGIQKEGKKVYTNLQATDALTDEDTAATTTTFEDKEQVRNSKGLVVSQGQGIHVFTNENSLAKEFAAVVNLYAQTLPLRVICAVTPTAGTYKMPQDYLPYANKEVENITEMYGYLKNVQTVPIHQALQQHDKEYIFYRTDHHWTALGAYYGYVAFCKQLQLTPQPLQTMPKNFVQGNFLGTHYLKTNDISLRQSPDTVFYWKPPVQATAQKWQNEKMVTCTTFKLDSIEKNRYLVFLGGDEPLMQLTSESVQNKKTILVIKNSYGNPFVSYLTANYQTVLVLDYRYFKGNLPTIIANYKVQDLLILSGVFAANEPTHIKKIKKLLKK